MGGEISYNRSLVLKNTSLLAENRAEGEIFSERGGTREQVRAYFMK